MVHAGAYISMWTNFFCHHVRRFNRNGFLLFAYSIMVRVVCIWIRPMVFLSSKTSEMAQERKKCREGIRYFLN